jgi:NAD(P)H-hydrate repair Nnr-like enzyme with NAD(P)H-hydrate epimerase domain
MPSFESLYTADEMKVAEAGHDVKELMARAGRAVAEEAMRRFPAATGGSRSRFWRRPAGRRGPQRTHRLPTPT